MKDMQGATFGTGAYYAGSDSAGCAQGQPEPKKTRSLLSGRALVDGPRHLEVPALVDQRF